MRADLLEKFSRGFKWEKDLDKIFSELGLKSIKLNLFNKDNGTKFSSVLLYEAKNGEFIKLSNLLEQVNSFNNSNIKSWSIDYANILKENSRLYLENDGKNKMGIKDHCLIIEDWVTGLQIINKDIKFLNSWLLSEKESNPINSLSLYNTKTLKSSKIFSKDKDIDEPWWDIIQYHNQRANNDYINQIVKNSNKNFIVNMMPLLDTDMDSNTMSDINSLDKNEAIKDYTNLQESVYYNLPSLEVLCDYTLKYLLRIIVGLETNDYSKIPASYSFSSFLCLF